MQKIKINDTYDGRLIINDDNKTFMDIFLKFDTIDISIIYTYQLIGGVWFKCGVDTKEKAIKSASVGTTITKITDNRWVYHRYPYDKQEHLNELYKPLKRNYYATILD